MTLLFLLACTPDKPSTGFDDETTGDTADRGEDDGGGDDSGGDNGGGDNGSDDGSDDGVERALVFGGDRPTSLLMISWDTTRRDRVGRYDSEPSVTPNLDALLASGVPLDDHRSCSNWTYASVLCVQAGMSDVEAGFIPTTGEDAAKTLPDDLLLSAEVMRDLGYQTALVATNSWFSPDSNTSQGFEHIRYNWGGKAEWTAESALDFFDEREIDPDRPWYVHVHFMDPHIPYNPPGEYLGGLEGLAPLDFDLSIKANYWDLEGDWETLDEETRALALAHLDVRYRGELSFVDDQLGALLAGLESRGVLDDALIAFWTDHGEQHLEHGEVGHAEDLYEPENLSVAGFAGGGLIPGAWGGPTTHADLFPTALDALGLEAPASWTGRLVGARPADDHRFALRHDAEDGEVLQLVERGGVKLLYSWDGTRELYYPGDDPLEVDDRYDPEDPEVAALWALLLPQVEAVQAIHPELSPVDPGP